jgi:hypothetical protein
LLAALVVFRKFGVRVEYCEGAQRARFLETLLSAIADYEAVKRRSR